MQFQSLERRTLYAAQPVISEFLASNSAGLVDGNGNHSDWIEIYNAGDASVDLAGWHLSDNAAQLAKWTFPSVTLNAGTYLVVVADSATTSGPDSLGYLHTNFSLSADGETLSLSRPDNTVVSRFAADGSAYPAQRGDVSYGTTKVLNNVTSLIAATSPAKALVPTTNALDGNTWTSPSFSDSSWKSGALGAGYDGGGTVSSAGLLARWYAPSLALADNAAIASWSASTGTGTAAQSTSTKRPTYQSDAASLINAHAVVRFDGSDDNLLVTNQSLSGLSSFTVAMVFRTSTAGKAGTQWYNNNGIVDAEVGGVTNDWGLAINDAGAIGAGVGNPDVTTYSAGGLANGAAHTVVMTKAGTTVALSIDGGAPRSGTVSASARTISELMFGSLHTNINFFAGDIGEVRLYNTAMTDDAARSLSSEMAGTWGVPLAAGAYTSSIGLSLQTEMAGVASTAAIRVPFNVDNPTLYDTLTLNMKYDDGFVAYLSGTEVARRNTPVGPISYLSTAASARSDTSALTAESIDLSPYLNLLQGGGATNVLAIRALNVSAGDSDLLIAPELSIATSSIGPAYMTTPTPGAANAIGYAGLASPVTSSLGHGYYTSPISTTLTTPTIGATIVYTLDGSTPTLSNGTQVAPPPGGGPTSVTLNISSTSVLRAAAFKIGFLPSKVTATSYFFVNDIVQQPEFTPSGAYWDVGMDTDVVNATQTYSVRQALVAIPTISMSIDDAQMFGAANGIYTHPLNEGDAWERMASIEYFDPNNATAQFTVNAGVRINGSVSRQTSRPKKAFKLYFRSEYGDASLNYPIFGTTNPLQAFEHLILRAGHNHSWANLGGTTLTTGDYLRDQFSRDTQLAIEGKALNGGWAQLYINGQYWGLYNTEEDLDPEWAATNYGGNSDDYDIVKPTDTGGVEPDDGNLTAWNKLFADADAAFADGVVDNTEYANIATQVDTRALADYMLSIIYRGDQDSPVLIGSTTSPRNFIGLHNRADPNGKFYFQTQDGELSIDSLTFDRTEVFGNQNPGRLYQQLRTNGEFRQIIIDEVQRLFYNNGPLIPAANQARYNAIKAQVNVAIVGESARWGNAKQAQVAMRDTDWVNETNWITNTYMPQRTTVVLNQLKADFPELNTAAPTANVNGVPSSGGVITPGSMISLSDSNSPAGAIYYTLDGTDPRATGGAIVGTAYTGPFTLNTGTRVLARVLRSGVWSPLMDVTFTTSVPVRISEVHYHPAPTAGVADPEDLEFVELVNTSTSAINLQGITISQAFDYTFSSTFNLAGGARVVIVRNAIVFQQIYGTGINLAPGAGYSPQNLSNSGERILLTGPLGETLQDFTYDDAAPWPITPDGSGPSLEIIDPTADPTNPANWRASAAIGGSPGTSGITPPIVSGSAFGYLTGHSISFTFDHDMNTSSFATTDASVQLTSGGPSITPSSFSYSAATKTLTFNFATPFGDGDYTATLASGSVTDTAGTALGSAYGFPFFALAGDANRDRAVDVTDLGVLATNWQGTGKNFGQGDFNYDGIVDVTDLGILATNWQKVLPGPSSVHSRKASPRISLVQEIELT